MKALIYCISVIGAYFLLMTVLEGSGKASYESHTDAFGTSVSTMTDSWGNKTECHTMIVGSSVSSRCN